MAFASLDPGTALCPFAVFLALSLSLSFSLTLSLSLTLSFVITVCPRLSFFSFLEDWCFSVAGIRRRLPARKAVSAASISDTCTDSMGTSTRDSTSRGLCSVVGLIESCVRNWSALPDRFWD